MSKTMKCQINIFDPDAVRDTLKEIGVPFEENAVWAGWYSRQREKVDVLVVPDRSKELNFGVGFRRNEEGGLEIVHEDLGGQGSRDLIDQFKRIYGIKAAIRQLEKFGYRMTRLEDGSYRARSTIRTTGLLSRRTAMKEKTTIVQRIQRRF